MASIRIEGKLPVYAAHSGRSLPTFRCDLRDMFAARRLLSARGVVDIDEPDSPQPLISSATAFTGSYAFMTYLLYCPGLDHVACAQHIALHAADVGRHGALANVDVCTTITVCWRDAAGKQTQTSYQIHGYMDTPADVSM